MASLPIIGELVTTISSGSKLIAAGVTRPFSEDTSDKFLNGAGRDWIEYSERNVIAGSINAGIEKLCGNDKEATRIIEKVGSGLVDVVDSTPVVGHIKGTVHYIRGETEKGHQCMKNASRSTAVAGLSAVTGGVGGIAVGGLTGAATGAGYDATVSLIADEPYGLIQALTDAEEDPNAIISSMMIVGGDVLTGAMAAKAKQRANKANKISAEKKTLTKKMGADATKDTIGAAKDLKRAIKSVDRGNGHNEGKPVASLVRENNTDNTATGYNTSLRKKMRVDDFRKHGKASGYTSVNNAKKSGQTTTSVLQNRYPEVKQKIPGTFPNACAEQDAYNKYCKLPTKPDTTNSRMVTVKYDSSSGIFKTEPRCDNCKAYSHGMGRVPTDNVGRMPVPTGSAGAEAAKCAALTGATVAIGARAMSKAKKIQKKRD